MPDRTHCDLLLFYRSSIIGTLDPVYLVLDIGSGGSSSTPIGSPQALPNRATPYGCSCKHARNTPAWQISILVTSQILCVLCPPTALHDCAHEDEDASGEELSSDDEEELLVSAVEVKVPADFATNDLGWVWRAVHVRTIR